MNSNPLYNSLGYLITPQPIDTQLLAYNTSQISTLQPVSGVMIYDTDQDIPLLFDGDIWIPLAGPIFDPADHTKQIEFDCTAIPSDTTRRLIMPNADVDLREMWDVPENLKLLTNSEAAQLLNINANVISTGNWGYLSSLDQVVGKSSSPEFGSPLFKTSLVVEDPGVGTETVTIQAPTIPALGSYTLTLPTTSGSQYELLRNSGSGVTAWSADLSTSNFRIGDFSDPAPANWKRIAFALDAGFTAGATRTITMPDADVDLGDVAFMAQTAINGVKTYTASFTIAVDTAALDYPQIILTFDNTTPFYADIRLVSVDFTANNKIGLWSGKVCGGTLGAAAANLALSEVSVTGDTNAVFSTDATTTATSIAITKTANFSAVAGSLPCQLFVSVGNSRLVSVVGQHPASAAPALGTINFTY